MLKIVGISVLCAFIVVVMGSKLEELKQEYMKVIKECESQHPLTASDMQTLAKRELPQNENVNCLLACTFKKTGMMDDEGKLSVEGVRRATVNYLSDDPEMLQKTDEFTDACKNVNDVPVSDGAKGCERARLIFQCSLEKAPKVNLF